MASKKEREREREREINIDKYYNIMNNTKKYKLIKRKDKKII
jgi:hypothetical protein